MTVVYKGFYTDSTGTREIEMENDFNELSTVIDGIVFRGSEFSDLCIIKREKYTPEQLARFSFYPLRIYGTNLIEESLCNCSFEIVMPLVIIDKLNNAEIHADLKVEYVLGAVRTARPNTGIDEEKMTLTLILAGETYTGTGGLFEEPLDHIRNQMRDKFHFKNCYGCQYGDYSVYGQSSFGCMQCYKNQKEQYNKVTNKEEYMELENPDRNVQETYCCDEFEIRQKGAGYRG